MLTADLSDSYAKLERAEEHIADVKVIISAFLETDFYGLRLEVDERTRMARLHFDSLHQLDKRLNIVLGDALSNLRSALDYLYFAATGPITGIWDKGGFPFADDEPGFQGEVKKRIAPCGDAVRDLFIDKVQAYEGGNGEPLWVLNKLRNIDKHRLLVSTVNIAGVVASFRAGTIEFRHCEWLVEAGKSCAMVQVPANGPIQLTAEPQTTFVVEINEPPDVSRLDVISFLDSASEQVKSLLDAFKVLCN